VSWIHIDFGLGVSDLALRASADQVAQATAVSEPAGLGFRRRNRRSGQLAAVRAVNRTQALAISRPNTTPPNDPGDPSMRALLRVLFVSSVLSAGIQTADATYTFEKVGSPTSTGGFAYAINNAGQVATTDLIRSYVFQDGSLVSWEQIVIPGTATGIPGVVAQGINDSGVVVGRYRIAGNPANQTSGFVLGTDGVLTTVDVPGVAGTSISDINNNGDLVGETRSDLTVFGLVRGFARRGGSFAEISYPGSVLTRAYGINDAGDIVGQFQLADSINRPFLLSGNTFTELLPIDPPGGLQSALATGISDNGLIVGTYRDSANATKTWVRMADGSYDYPSLPGSGWGINDGAQISGSFLDASNGNVRTAFVASIPEPSTFLMFGLGVVGLFVSRLRKGRITIVSALRSGFRKSTAAAVFVLGGLGVLPAQAQHAGDVLIGQAPSGQIVAIRLPDDVLVLPPVSAGVLQGWADFSLGFDSVFGDSVPGIAPLSAGAEIHLEIVSIDVGLSLRPFTGFTVVSADAPGDRLRIGSTGDLHWHPIAFIDSAIVGTKFSGELDVAFRLIDLGVAGHAASPSYSLTFATPAPPVPEPAESVLIAFGLGALVVFVRRHRA